MINADKKSEIIEFKESMTNGIKKQIIRPKTAFGVPS